MQDNHVHGKKIEILELYIVNKRVHNIVISVIVTIGCKKNILCVILYYKSRKLALLFITKNTCVL